MDALFPAMVYTLCFATAALCAFLLGRSFRRFGSRLLFWSEVNSAYREPLEKGGLVFSGMSPDGLLPEIVERPDHPWFVGVQFHPELKSRPFEPHPLFASFIAAAVEQSRLV